MRAQSRRGCLTSLYSFDKCLGEIDVRESLAGIGAAVEILTDHFPQDAKDHVWISEVGKRGWVILTKDGRLLTNGLIVRALLSSNTHSFVLRAKDMTGEQMGRAFVTAYPSMLKMITKFQPPLVAQVSRAGVPKLLVTYDQLVNRLDPR